MIKETKVVIDWWWKDSDLYLIYESGKQEILINAFVKDIKEDESKLDSEIFKEEHFTYSGIKKIAW